jgi:hypothetical protein
MIVFAVLGLAIVISAVGLRLTNALGIGPGMFPLVSGLLIGGLGLVGALRGLRKLRSLPAEPADGPFEEVPVTYDGSETPQQSEETFTSVSWPLLAIALMLVVVFVFVVPILGFVLALSLLTFGLMRLVARRGWLMCTLLAIGTGALTYYGFGVFLGIHMTPSSLAFLSWLDT